MSQVSRRSLLAGVGMATAGTVVGQLLSVARAAEAQGQAGAGICLSMLFENGAKAKFDRTKYTAKHLPLLREVYGDSVERIELRTPPEGSRGGMPPAVLATTTLWIRDVAGFSQKLGANAERINKDLDAVANGNRLVQPDRIVLGMGDARADVPADSEVFSLYYRAALPGRGGMPRGGARGPGGAPPAAPAGAPASAEAQPAAPPVFDAAFFTGTYLPKLHSLYGAKAVRRLEATTGMDQGAQKATQIAAYHLYIRDRAAYDAASRTVFTELQQESGKFMSYMPVFADLRVTAIV